MIPQDPSNRSQSALLCAGAQNKLQRVPDRAAAVGSNVEALFVERVEGGERKGHGVRGMST